MENCSADFAFVDSSQCSLSQDEVTENAFCGTSQEVQDRVESYHDHVCVSDGDSSSSGNNTTEDDVFSNSSRPVTGSPFSENASRFKWTQARKDVLVKLFLETKNSNLPRGKRLELLSDRFKSTEEGKLCALKSTSLEKASLRILKNQYDPLLHGDIDDMLISLSKRALEIYSLQSKSANDQPTFLRILTDLFKINNFDVTEASIVQRYCHLRKTERISVLPLLQNGQIECKSESEGISHWGFLTDDQHVTAETREDCSSDDFFFTDGSQFRPSQNYNASCDISKDVQGCTESSNDQIYIDSAYRSPQIDTTVLKYEDNVSSGNSSSATSLRILENQIDPSFDNDIDHMLISLSEYALKIHSFQSESANDNSTFVRILIDLFKINNLQVSEAKILQRYYHLRKTEQIDALPLLQYGQSDSKSLSRVHRWRAQQENRQKERERDALRKREKRRQIQMIATLDESTKEAAAERMRRWRAYEENREKERERDALKKREKRKDPTYRERERISSRLSKREKRKNDHYREVERARNKLAMREKRKDESFREKERERNKLSQRKKRAKEKIDYLCSRLKPEDIPATEYINEVNSKETIGNCGPDLVVFKEEPVDELTVNQQQEPLIGLEIPATEYINGIGLRETIGYCVPDLVVFKEEPVDELTVNQQQEPLIEYVKNDSGLGVCIKQENLEEGSGAVDSHVPCIKQEM